MGAAENKDLVRRWIEEGWNADQNERVMREVFSEDWVDGDDPAGPHGWDGIRDFVRTYRNAFPDVHIEILQLAVGDEFVAFRWRAEGTHEGSLFGVEPTNRRKSFMGHTMHRVEEGRLNESWVQTNTISLLKQLGVSQLPD